MTEHQIQSAFMDWVRLEEKQDERLKLLFAVPNGGKRNPVTASLLKRAGVRAGVLDIFFPYRTSMFIGLAIEFKSPTGTMADDQKGYADLLTQQGWLVVVRTDTEQAIRTVKRYLAV